MLTMRAGRLSGLAIISSGFSRAAVLNVNAPPVESCSPPPICFQEPMSAGSMQTARAAAPPFCDRCMP